MIELYPHQQEAITKLSNGKILRGEVGTGKSFTALAYYFTKVLGGTLGDFGSVKQTTPLYIFTTARKRDTLDWEKDAAALGLLANPLFSIVVESWNNAPKYKDVTDAFIIWDEQRAVGSGVWAKTFIHMSKANQWIMLSATPADSWLDLVPVFIANGFYKNRTEFKREHVVYNIYSKFPKVDRYVGTGRLVRLRNQILVEMPYMRETVRDCKDVVVDYDKSIFEKVVKKRWHVYEERPLRDVGELFIVMRKVVNSSPSRIQMVERLMREHAKLIIFYNFDYELEMLRSLARGETATFASQKDASEKPAFALAEWNGHKHEEIPKTDRWVYLVQYTAGSEGWNCIETDAMIFYSQTYSYKQFAQAHGRIDRLNTPYKTLYYYHFTSSAWIDLAINKALKQKKSFNEGVLRAKMDDFG